MTTCFSFPLLFFSVLQRPVPSFFLSRYLIIALRCSLHRHRCSTALCCHRCYSPHWTAVDRHTACRFLVRASDFLSSCLFCMYLFLTQMSSDNVRCDIELTLCLLILQSVYAPFQKSHVFYDCDHFVTERERERERERDCFAVHFHIKMMTWFLIDNYLFFLCYR